MFRGKLDKLFILAGSHLHRLQLRSDADIRCSPPSTAIIFAALHFIFQDLAAQGHKCVCSGACYMSQVQQDYLSVQPPTSTTMT